MNLNEQEKMLVILVIEEAIWRSMRDIASIVEGDGESSTEGNVDICRGIVDLDNLRRKFRETLA